MKTKFKNGVLYQGDCLEIMPMLPAQSVDMILCDLPYGVTACKWDAVIPFEPLWKEYKRLIKPRGAIVLTASQPFTSALVMSNAKDFKYCWYWLKSGVTGFANAKKQPLRCVEEVAVFSPAACVYYPQGLKSFSRIVNKGKSAGGVSVQGENVGNEKGALRSGLNYLQEWTNYPRQVLNFSASADGKLHPTQKPVALFEYLIKTYTQPDAAVLDNCAGSGTTGAACDNTGREFVLIEREEKYCEVIKNRVK